MAIARIGLAGFEPATCRRGDRTTTQTYRDHRDPFPVLKYRSFLAASARFANASLYTEAHGIPCRVALEWPELRR